MSCCRELRTSLIRLAHSDPEMRPLILPLLSKQAALGLARMKPGDHTTLKSGGVYAHVWFDDANARDDFGNPAKDSGEWQVIITTSEDPLNLNPRGRELARDTFRYVESRSRGLVAGSAEDFIRRAWSRFKGRVAGDRTAKPWGKLPKGWTEESVKKFWKSVGGKGKHKVTACIEKMTGKIDDPGAFCASLADRMTPGWRSKKKDK